MVSCIEIWTDGCCLRNPGGEGGWSYRIIYPDAQRDYLEGSGGEPNTTNNRMELMAMIRGLERLHADTRYAKRIFFCSDSKYVLQGMESWVKKWKSKKWRTSTGQPVLNQDLWEKLDNLRMKIPKECRLIYKHIPGHAGHEHNEWCDQRASTEARLL